MTLVFDLDIFGFENREIGPLLAQFNGASGLDGLIAEMVVGRANPLRLELLQDLRFQNDTEVFRIFEIGFRVQEDCVSLLPDNPGHP